MLLSWENEKKLVFLCFTHVQGRKKYYLFLDFVLYTRPGSAPLKQQVEASTGKEIFFLFARNFFSCNLQYLSRLSEQFLQFKTKSIPQGVAFKPATPPRSKSPKSTKSCFKFYSLNLPHITSLSQLIYLETTSVCAYTIAKPIKSAEIYQFW